MLLGDIDYGAVGHRACSVQAPRKFAGCAQLAWHCAIFLLQEITLKSGLRLPDLLTLGAKLKCESPVFVLRQVLEGPSREAYGAGSLFIFRLPEPFQKTRSGAHCNPMMSAFSMFLYFELGRAGERVV